jgi:hypothetical protein
MATIIVKTDLKRLIVDIGKLTRQEKLDTELDLFATITRRSPVRSGQYKKSWTKRSTKAGAVIGNAQPYAEKLEVGPGRSRQAPLGVVIPSINEVIKRRQTTRRTIK